MEVPSPYPRLGRPRIEDEPERTVTKTVRLPEDFVKWFQAAAKASGLSWENAAREALLEWGKKHHPKSAEAAETGASRTGKP